ncbi:MAG: membrane protein insertion efficiency factor YidD [Vicinamibacteria bacterium]
MRRTLVGLAVLVVLVAVDLTRPPDRQWASAAAVAGVRVYQVTLSRVYASLGVTCRFTPSCSHYGIAVLREHGLLRGGWLAASRVLRCGPWTPAGTTDPPPPGPVSGA